MDFLPEDPVLKFHPDALQVIRKMHNLDDKERLNQSIDILEDWVRKQSHLKKQFSRGYYERKIVVSKGSVEKAKAQIDKLCTLKTLMPKFFICRDVDKHISCINEIVHCLPLPDMTEDYCRIYLIKVLPGEYTAEKIFGMYKYAIMKAEYLMSRDFINGYCVICDVTEANLVDLLKSINFVELQQFLTILIEAYGARVPAIHMVSQSKVIDLFAKTLKSVLPPKIGNRLHIHRDLDTLYKVIDRKQLPSDMGGDQKTLRELQDKWIETVSSEEHLKYLEEMVESRSDETLRQIDKFNDQCMGLPGSFRTLTVD